MFKIILYYYYNFDFFSFQPYLKDNSIKDPKQVKKVFLCCGKVYYELKAERKKREMDEQVALCRVEQLFPFPYKDIADDVKEYSNAEIYWAQEEHKNQVKY